MRFSLTYMACTGLERYHRLPLDKRKRVVIEANEFLQGTLLRFGSPPAQQSSRPSQSHARYTPNGQNAGTGSYLNSHSQPASDQKSMPDISTKTQDVLDLMDIWMNGSNGATSNNSETPNAENLATSSRIQNASSQAQDLNPQLNRNTATASVPLSDPSTTAASARHVESVHKASEQRQKPSVKPNSLSLQDERELAMDKVVSLQYLFSLFGFNNFCHPLCPSSHFHPRARARREYRPLLQLYLVRSFCLTFLLPIDLNFICLRTVYETCRSP